MLDVDDRAHRIRRVPQWVHLPYVIAALYLPSESVWSSTANRQSPYRATERLGAGGSTTADELEASGGAALKCKVQPSQTLERGRAMLRPARESTSSSRFGNPGSGLGPWVCATGQARRGDTVPMRLRTFDLRRWTFALRVVWRLAFPQVRVPVACARHGYYI